MKKVEESNKLIAEFMGFKVPDSEFYGGYRIVVPNELQEIDWDNEKVLPSPVENKTAWNAFDFSNLKFHQSWDWLMEAVKKIQSLGYIVKLNSNGVACYVVDPSITDTIQNITPIKWGTPDKFFDVVYQVVIEFIKWYNKN